MSKYFVMYKSVDGPGRIEGTTSYTALAAAQKRAEQLCIENPKHKYMVLKLEVEFWLDPKPTVLNSYPEVTES